MVLLVVLAGLGQTVEARAQTTTATDRELLIKTIERRPFTIVNEGEFSGFSIDIWRELANRLGLKYRFEAAGSFTDMLKAVESGEADAAIANISITASREEVMDFTQPIFDAGLQIMVPVRGAASGILAAIFTWEMFGLLSMGALIVFAAGSLMWVFERRAQPYFETPYNKEGAWRSFWWALIVVVNGGFEERRPQSWPGRLFATILVVSSLFVVSIFVAKITATITIGELRSSVQSVNDLFGKRVGTTTGSTSAGYLASRSVRFSEFDNIEGLFKSLESGEIDAVVHDAPILAYYAKTRGQGVVRTAGGIFRPEKYGIALQQDNPLVERINRELLRIREDGTYRQLIERWFGEDY